MTDVGPRERLGQLKEDEVELANRFGKTFSLTENNDMGILRLEMT